MNYATDKMLFGGSERTARRAMMMDWERATLRAASARLPELLGGRICLDFANTVEPRGAQVPLPPHGRERRDHLRDYAGLVAWARYAALIEEGVALDLLAWAAERPAAAATLFARAVALREVIYRTFATLARGEEPRADDLALVAAEHAAAATAAALVPAEEGFVWSWAARDDDLARPLWPLAWSATALLTGEEWRRVKVCPGTPDAVVPCAWLFYDATKNRIRHWCSMADCGSKTKALRQTNRRRAARAAAPPH